MQMYINFGAWLHKCFFYNEDDVLMVQRPLLICHLISHVMTALNFW